MIKAKIYPTEIAKNICKNKLYNGRDIRVLEEANDFFLIEVKNNHILRHINNLNVVDSYEVVKDDR